MSTSDPGDGDEPHTRSWLATAGAKTYRLSPADIQSVTHLRRDTAMLIGVAGPVAD